MFSNEKWKGIGMASVDIGIDLGTSSILVYAAGRGIVLKEPSVAAYDKDNGKVVAMGEEARQMIQKTQGNIIAIHPLRQGVIADYNITEMMLKYFILKAIGRRAFRKPRITICIPSGITEVEKMAVEQAAYQAGAREVFLIEAPIAAAVGVGIDIKRPCGNMIVDIGGGTSDMAIISLGSTVVSHSIKVAGSNFNEAIMRHVRKNHNLFIGEQIAESIKMKIGTVWDEPEVRTMEVKGRNVITGLPQVTTLTSVEIRQAMRDCTIQILDGIHHVLEQTPPELAADIVDRGIVLTGGGALLNGMENLVEQKTGINTLLAEEPMFAAVVGTGRYAKILDEMK